MAAFQSTRPRGARRAVSHGHASSGWRFNPRARAGRDHATCARYSHIDCDVSIHAPARGATLHHRRTVRSMQMFQSTRPRGARRATARPIGKTQLFQSTRPRGARRHVAQPSTNVIVVSIHAPARGATRSWPPLAIGFRRFQSTRPRGARPVQRGILPGCLRVSIHAPARGATVRGKPSCHSVTVFQSTRPRGARRSMSRLAGRVRKFQSTRPRGARRR